MPVLRWVTLTVPLPRTNPPLPSTTAKQPAHGVLDAGEIRPLVVGVLAAAPPAANAPPEASAIPNATARAATPRSFKLITVSLV